MPANYLLMIIAVDFDGTLYKDGVPNRVLIGRLRACQARGDIVILWTCREGKKLNDAVLFLRKNGFMPNYVNTNALEAIERFGTDSRKVYADVYIDNKNG